ncbi:MAG: sapC family protein [Proteobacteria bacterium]|nr:sapC family protein [Pseudomonadota bacterium]
MATSTAKTSAAAPLPLFYTKPTLLDAASHAEWGLRKDMTFAFASGANALPVNIVEFPQIAHYYPIAFAKDAVATPVAVVGVRDNENLYINEEGNWLSGAYIPAYVRRYPFILSESPDGTQLSLCIDDAQGVVSRGSGEKFFDEKKQPTQVAKNAIEFCRSYHVAAKQTMTFGEALEKSGLLVDRSADITLKNGQRISFSGFRIIDEEKFNNLPAETLLEWRNKGWLAAVYAHLFSGLHWGTITRLVNERMPEAPAKAATKAKK